MKIERLGEARYQLGESPVWDDRQGVLYFVDAMACAVFRLDPRSGAFRRWDVAGGYLGAMALREGGGAVLVMDNGFHSFDFETGQATAIAEPEADNPETGFNDCKVDRQGRLIGGSLHTGATEPLGGIFRLDPDHTCTRLDGSFIEFNGPCWSPDGRTFYVADSYANVIYAHDYDPATGMVSNRRPFFSTQARQGEPDGATVDAEGYLWSAQFGAGVILRIAPDGTVARTLEVPVSWVSCMTHGGENRDVLYVTSIGGELNGERDTTPEAGSLYAIHGLGVQGLPEPRFAG